MTEVQIALLFVKDSNPTIFDVGANDGHYTREILSRCSTSFVHAFEPDGDREIFNFHDDRVKSHLIALSSKEENRTLYKPDGLHTHNSFHVRPHFNQSALESSICECKTVDSIVEQYKIEKIDFLKIDTEGNEMEVLTGATRSFQSGIIKAGQFEYGGTWKERGIKFLEAYQFLTNLGFQIFKFDDNNKQIQMNESFQDDWDFTNFYFAKRED